ncbi:hypothetical protein Tco_1141791, partial [Tanacetum coccineum]
IDYSTDGGDDRDDEDKPSEEDEDDDVDIEADEEEEEEEHPTPADSVLGFLFQLQYLHHYGLMQRLPDFSLYLPHHHHHSPVLSPAPPPSPIRSLGYRAAMIRMRVEAASTSHSLPLPPPFILSPTRPDVPSLGIPPPLPISVPTSSPLLLLPSASRREERPEVTLPPRKRLGIALGSRYEVEESSSTAVARPDGGLKADYGFVATMDREIRHDPEREVGYRITDSWDEIVKTLQGAPVSTETELGRHMTTFETRVRQDTYEVYTRLDDEQSQRQLLAGQLNMLLRDRRAHAYTRHQIETEARLSREGWRRSMDASDLVRGEVMSLRTTVLDHWRSAEMRELRTADHTRQQQLIQTLIVVQSLQREVTPLLGQGQVIALQGQQGPAGGPAQPELPEETGSSSYIRSCYG